MVRVCKKLINPGLDVTDRFQCKRDATLVGIYPETNDLELRTRFLLLIFKRAGNILPEDQKLDLTPGLKFAMIKHFITFEVEPKEVVHIYMEAGDVQLLNSYPT